MEKFLQFVADSLVEHPERVRIETEANDHEQVFTLYLDREDLGRLIGRHGKTAEALRTLLSAMHRRDARKPNLRIRELD